MAEQKISGIFVIEQVTTQLGTKVVRLGFSTSAWSSVTAARRRATTSASGQQRLRRFRARPRGRRRRDVRRDRLHHGAPGRIGGSLLESLKVSIRSTPAARCNEVIGFDGVAVATTREGTTSSRSARASWPVPAGSSWTLGFDKNGDGRLAASEITSALHGRHRGAGEGRLGRSAPAPSPWSAPDRRLHLHRDLERHGQPPRERWQRPGPRPAAGPFIRVTASATTLTIRHPRHQGPTSSSRRRPHVHRQQRDGHRRVALRLRPSLHVRPRPSPRWRNPGLTVPRVRWSSTPTASPRCSPVRSAPASGVFTLRAASTSSSTPPPERSTRPSGSASITRITLEGRPRGPGLLQVHAQEPDVQLRGPAGDPRRLLDRQRRQLPRHQPRGVRRQAARRRSTARTTPTPSAS